MTYDPNLEAKVFFNWELVEFVQPASSEEVLKVIKNFGVKNTQSQQRSTDKCCHEGAAPTVCRLVNKLLAEGTMEGISHS